MKLLIPAVVLCGAVSVVFAQSLAPSPMETWKQAEKERKEDQLCLALQRHRDVD